MDEGGSREAIKDIHDYFVKDIIKKGYMGKKMDYLPAFREHYFVLQPQVRQINIIKKINKKNVYTPSGKEFRESAFFGHCADLLAWSLVCYKYV